jgi:hypothetical protein
MAKYNIYYNFKPDLAKNMSVGKFILCPIKTMTLGGKVGLHVALGNGQTTTLANGSHAVLNVNEKRAKKIVAALIASNWCEKINVEKMDDDTFTF